MFLRVYVCVWLVCVQEETQIEQEREKGRESAREELEISKHALKVHISFVRLGCASYKNIN